MKSCEEEMKLSIIIPIYNVEEYLADTIETVLNQTFKDFELILVDDGSTDGSGDICDKAALKDDRVRVIHKTNAGVSEARNTGVKAAKGEYIGFVDSDDIIEPCMYEIMINAAQEYDCEIIQCEHDRNDSLSYKKYSVDDNNFMVSSGDKVVNDIFIKKGGRCTNILALWSKIYKRELFEEIIFPPGKVYEDEARTYQIILKAKRVGELDIPLYHYVKRENSIITGIAIKKCLDKAWALKDRMEFFRNEYNEFFGKAVVGYMQYLKSLYVDMYKGIVIYSDEDKKIRELIKADYKLFMKYADKYTKLYLFMIKNNIMVDWILKNDFEPIQRILSGIKG
jgi:glycosyltransferase involved in cell wall biosynthesis